MQPGPEGCVRYRVAPLGQVLAILTLLARVFDYQEA